MVLLSAGRYPVREGTISPNATNSPRYSGIFLYYGDNSKSIRCQNVELYLCDSDIVFVNVKDPHLYTAGVDQFSDAICGMSILRAINEPFLSVEEI